MTDPARAGWASVRELFDAVLDRPPGERQSFLAAAASGDDALLRRVQSLLESDAIEDGILDRVPARLQEVLARIVPVVAVLAPGDRIGAYEIVGSLGAGGMGEVYRARDLKLGRDVAIKVLPHPFTADAQRLARFEREARVLASLNHPNIGAIYGVEDPAPGSAAIATRALVLELVDGDTLAERIARGRGARGSGVGLARSDALRFAAQIAEALETAHGKGVIHRDLKPANIKITPKGVVKVLDFGLAKAAVADDVSVHDLSQSPTIAIEGTRVGMVFGTAPYMSPEQARGAPVDERGDIWAFGCIVYEMFAGRRAFAGDTLSDTIAGILDGDPDWGALPATTPPKIHDLLRRCLQKDPNRRLHDIADARVEIEDVLAPPPQPRIGRQAWLAVGAVVAVALGLAAVALLQVGRRTIPATTDWVQITNFPDAATQPALSPDGRLLAFIRGPGTFTTEGQLYVKLLPDGEPVPLTGDTVLKAQPVFSPDGSRIAYSVADGMSGWTTWIVPALRGEPRIWLRNAAGLSWTARDRLMFSTIGRGQGMRVVTAADGGTDLRDVYVPAHQDGMAHSSRLSPDNTAVLVVEMDDRGVWLPCRLVRLADRSPGRAVGPSAARCTDAAWAPDGKWMYFSADTGDGFHVWRQRYPTGQPEQITSTITQEQGLAIAPDGGSLITSVGFRRRAIFVHERNGAERQIPLEGYAFWPLLSSDGQKVCYRVARSAAPGQSPTELWMTELSSGRSARVVPAASVTSYDLTGEDRVVAAMIDADGKSRVWLAWLDGREPPRQIPGIEGDNPRFASRTEIVFRAQDGASTALFRVNDDGTNRQQLARTNGAKPTVGQVSPDGRWVSVMSGGSAGDTGPPILALYSTAGDEAVPVYRGTQVARLRWRDDRVYLSIQAGDASSFAAGRTYMLPLQGGSMLPRIPAGGFGSEQDLAAVPGVQILPLGDLGPGPSSSEYAFSRETVSRNLYRIPLHE